MRHVWLGLAVVLAGLSHSGQSRAQPEGLSSSQVVTLLQACIADGEALNTWSNAGYYLALKCLHAPARALYDMLEKVSRTDEVPFNGGADTMHIRYFDDRIVASGQEAIDSANKINFCWRETAANDTAVKQEGCGLTIHMGLILGGTDPLAPIWLRHEKSAPPP